MLRQARAAQRAAALKELREQVIDLERRNPKRLYMLLRRDPDLVRRLWARWADEPAD